MSLFSRKDLIKYGAEILVVVLGILIAFQVDEWRDGLQVDRDLHAALVRLKKETESNLVACKDTVPLSVRLTEGVQMVLKSVHSGQLRDVDIGKFEYGLTHVGFLPGRNYLTTVAEEMIATGLLKELENADLQASIAGAMIENELFQQRISTQSPFMRSVMEELARTVIYGISRPTALDAVWLQAEKGMFEDSVTVDYDIATMTENSYLKNLLIETTDGYIDLNRMNSGICDRIAKIDNELSSYALN